MKKLEKLNKTPEKLLQKPKKKNGERKRETNMLYLVKIK